MAIKTGIVGAAGFAGIELVRLVLRHPDLELAVATSNELAGTRVDAEYPGFAGATDLAFATHDDPALAACELVFLAVPHTAALAMAPRLVAGGATVIDLSADFRLKDPAVYEQLVQHPPHGMRPAGTARRSACPSSFPTIWHAQPALAPTGERALVACARLLSHGHLACGGARNPRWASRLQAAPLSSMPSRASRARARRPRRARISASRTRTSRPTAWARTATRPRSSRSSVSRARGASCSRRTSPRSTAGCSPRRTCRSRPTRPIDAALRHRSVPRTSTRDEPLRARARRRLPAEDLLGRRHEQRPHRPRRERARRACWSPCAPSTTWARARPPRPCNARTSCCGLPRATRLRRRRRARLIEGTR